MATSGSTEYTGSQPAASPLASTNTDLPYPTPTNIYSDDWRKIVSPADRRRAQNRVAQRSHRRQQKSKSQAGQQNSAVSLATAPSTATADSTGDTSCNGSLLTAPDETQTEAPWEAWLHLPRSGHTALHEAVMQDNEDMVALLLSYGSDTVVKNASGQTPLHLAAQRGNAAILAQLVGRGVSRAPDQRRPSSHTVPLDTPDDAGYTALHYAVANNHADVVRLLLDAGADVNVPTRTGMDLWGWGLF